MKRLTAAGLLIVSVLVLTLISNSFAKTETATISVKGMTCDDCVATVTKALEKVEGVTSVDVCLKSGSAKVSFDPQKTSVKALETAIADAGYSTDNVKANNPHKCDEKKEKPGCCEKSKKPGCCDKK